MKIFSPEASGAATRFFIGYWIITGVDFYPAPFLLYLIPGPSPQVEKGNKNTLLLFYLYLFIVNKILNTNCTATNPNRTSSINWFLSVKINS